MRRARLLVLLPLCVQTLPAPPSEIVLVDGLRMTADHIERDGDWIALRTREGAGRVETRIPLHRVERVRMPEGSATEEAFPWVRWLDPEDLGRVLETVRGTGRSLSPATRLEELGGLIARWPHEHPGRLSLLEDMGDLLAGLGWKDRLAETVEVWCREVGNAPPTSAWGWWRRAEALWRAGDIEGCAWIASIPLSRGISCAARGSSECLAYAAAAERRLGHPERADALLAGNTASGATPADIPELRPWMPGGSPPPQPAKDEAKPAPETPALPSIDSLRKADGLR